MDWKKSQDLAEARAFIDVTILILHADQKIRSLEVLELQERLNEHPKLKALSQEESTELIHGSVVDFEQQGIGACIDSIAAALTTTEQRLEAIGMGVAMSISDHDVDPRELDALKQMQTKFGLTDEQIAGAVERYL
jgi:tellurite resistance protein